MTSNNKKPGIFKLVYLLILLGLSQTLVAHTINYDLADAPTNDVVWFYLKLGFTHIIPEGFDHILFVIGLCLLSTKVKSILWQATAFTIAHSITLALSMRSIIVLPSGLVEPIIALSIMFVAVENLLLKELKPWRVLVVFLFGLIHGMGFASSLNEIGLPPGKFYTSIISFNVGVELGQIAIILAVFSLLIIPFKGKQWYRRGIVFPISIIIALIALFWTIQRLYF